jgi:hypothetical protein
MLSALGGPVHTRSTCGRRAWRRRLQDAEHLLKRPDRREIVGVADRSAIAYAALEAEAVRAGRLPSMPAATFQDSLGTMRLVEQILPDSLAL